MSDPPTGTVTTKPGESSRSTLDPIVLEPYTGEHQMQDITSLIEKELSEPYIVYTYRYFVNQWPSLCFLAYSDPASSTFNAAAAAAAEGEREAVGVVVCKLDRHLKGSRLFRGYIAMISVKHSRRGQGLAKRLVKRALEEMVGNGAQEVVLETEADNVAALALYERLGFIREKRLHRFYLNGKDSFRLVLPIPKSMQRPIPPELDLPPTTGLVQPPYPPPPSHAPSSQESLAITNHNTSHIL
ncbi:related to MAK3 N-acetyltransferase [Ustilago trichophora]|uniref:Related to MAK3 N-acetyltransferase n=1 Tax=Ustilago trichophora TaxID=86804 RepID=A0A5C3E5M4_9BASI|nr:related to MAK3 N-acetyltransferase [Ustilago trichophora]